MKEIGKLCKRQIYTSDFDKSAYVHRGLFMLAVSSMLE